MNKMQQRRKLTTELDPAHFATIHAHNPATVRSELLSSRSSPVQGHALHTDVFTCAALSTACNIKHVLYFQD